jgi:N-acyl-D-amino-acid deacylase
MVLFMMSEEDVTAILQHPAGMVGSDGLYSSGKPHPRYYGTFPRVLSKYVRQDKALSLEEAVRKMTSFPAQRLNIQDRGLLKAGMWADIVVFDPDKVEDKATFAEPQLAPSGIAYVLVNGQVAVRQGQYTGVLAGKVLRS